MLCSSEMRTTLTAYLLLSLLSRIIALLIQVSERVDDEHACRPGRTGWSAAQGLLAQRCDVPRLMILPSIGMVCSAVAAILALLFGGEEGMDPVRGRPVN